MKRSETKNQTRNLDNFISLLSANDILNHIAMSRIKGGTGDGGGDVIIIPPPPPKQD